jgi:hypothetical protein
LAEPKRVCKWRGELREPFLPSDVSSLGVAELRLHVRFRSVCKMGASSASPRVYSPVMPLEDVEFPLVRPVLRPVDVTVANRIIDHVMPLLCIGFGSTELPIPKVTLPNREAGYAAAMLA